LRTHNKPIDKLLTDADNHSCIAVTTYISSEFFFVALLSKVFFLAIRGGVVTHVSRKAEVIGVAASKVWRSAKSQSIEHRRRHRNGGSSGLKIPKKRRRQNNFDKKLGIFAKLNNTVRWLRPRANAVVIVVANAA
jgi:peptide subunit release factor 1 (eRF1)